MICRKLHAVFGPQRFVPTQQTRFLTRLDCIPCRYRQAASVGRDGASLCVITLLTRWPPVYTSDSIIAIIILSVVQTGEQAGL